MGTIKILETSWSSWNSSSKGMNPRRYCDADGHRSLEWNKEIVIFTWFYRAKMLCKIRVTPMVVYSKHL